VTNKKLIDKLRDYMDLDRKKQKDKRDKIRSLLKKLKKRQRALEEKLENADDRKTQERIQRDLKVLHSQRKKGVKLCKDIGAK